MPVIAPPLDALSETMYPAAERWQVAVFICWGISITTTKTWLLTITTVSQFQIQHMRVWEGALPYVAYRGMCHLTGFYFMTFLPSTGYIILGKSVLNRVWICPKKVRLHNCHCLIWFVLSSFLKKTWCLKKHDGLLRVGF